MFPSGLKRTSLATETYVDNQIDVNLPTGSVYELTAGHGLGVVGGGSVITTVGTLRLEAGLSSLNDVSSTTPLNDEVLTWDDGLSSWVPKTFTGSGTSPLVWGNLSDVQPFPGNNNYILRLNNTADTLEFVQNQLVYGPNIISGVGIDHAITYNNDGGTLRLDAKLSDIYTTTSSNNNTTLVIVDENNNQRRVRIGDVDLTDFSNVTDPFLQTNSINTVSPVAFNHGTNTFTLDNNRYRIDFNQAESIGISGVLPISHGGTSATNASDARDQLGVTYNVDVMSYRDPRFVGEMHGTDIMIRPYYLADSGISITAAGSGYSPGTSASIVMNTGSFPVTVATGASEQLTSVTAVEQGNKENFLDWNIDMTGTVHQGTESSGKVDLTARTGYINFGQQTGHDGYGIGYDGNFWFRQKGGDWLNNIPFDIQDADNVESTMTSTSAGSLMIWDGSQFQFHEVSGAISMTGNGVTTFGTGTIDPDRILATSGGLNVTIDRYEFGTLDGINTGMTIQEQLDNGISISTPVNPGDIIYHNGTDWSILPYDAGTDKVLVSTGLSAPSWNYVSSTYNSSNVYQNGDSILYLDNSSGTSTTLYTNMPNILANHAGGTGGIVIPGSVLSTDISSLPQVSGFNVSDFVMAVNNPTISTPLDEQIGVSAFVTSFAGTGLSSSGGQLTLDTGRDIIPDLDNTYDLGSSTRHWQDVYMHDIYLDPYLNTGAAGSPTEGKIVYVQNDGTGNPALACGDGSNWLKITLTPF